jgi:NAD(P)-dependent dehydrogenase (short-subunit alcohol dehydrogenase family)
MALTRCSAIEAVEYGVRINAVSPSIARHKFLDKTTSTAAASIGAEPAPENISKELISGGNTIKLTTVTC